MIIVTEGSRHGFIFVLNLDTIELETRSEA